MSACTRLHGQVLLIRRLWGEISLSLSSSKNRNPTELVENQPLALGWINTCLGWPKRKQSGKINFLNPANAIPNTLCACMKGLDYVYVWTLNLRSYMHTCSLCVSTHFRVYLIYTHAHIYLESFWERPIQGLCKVSVYSVTDVVGEVSECEPTGRTTLSGLSFLSFSARDVGEND